MVECGVAWFAHAEDGWDAASERTLAAQGIPVERLEVGEAARLYPSFARRRPRLRAVRARGGRAARAARRAGAGAAGAGPRRAARARRGRGPTARRRVLEDGTRLEGDAVVWACGGWLAGLFGDLVTPQGHAPGAAVRRRRPRVAAASRRGSTTTARCTAPATSTSSASRRRSTSTGPPLDPDAELVDTPTTEPHVRAYLRDRFPALEHAPLTEARACRYELSPDSHFIAGRHPEHAGRVAARRRLRPRLQARPGDGRADGRRARRRRRCRTASRSARGRRRAACARRARV